MTNTDRLYTAMRDFTNTRRENRETFLRTKKRLEGYKGSKQYDEDIKKAMKIRTDADEIARQACKKVVDETLNDMVKKNGTRGLTPPTEEQIRILTVAQMLKKPSKPTLDAIANSLGGNALALSALNDIAREAYKDDPDILARYTSNYAAKATEEMTAGDVHAAIRSLGKSCGDIMKSSVKKAAEIAKENHTRLYGGTYDPDDLPQEEPYMTERDFYNRTISANYDLFAKAVN